MKKKKDKLIDLAMKNIITSVSPVPVVTLINKKIHNNINNDINNINNIINNTNNNINNNTNNININSQINNNNNQINNIKKDEIQIANKINKNKDLPIYETSEIASNLENLYTKVFKDSKNTITNNNISDAEQLKLDFVKESSKFQPNKNDNFMNRMAFDVMKRQTQGKKLHDIIEKTKNKMDENQRVKGFNRLIEDANRRLEAQENLVNLKKKLEEQEDEKPIKKYKQEQWENIYNVRFKNYQKQHDDKIKLEIIKKEEEKKVKEENEIKMCQIKKKPMKNIIEYANKMYQDAKKKNKIKENKINYDKLVGKNFSGNNSNKKNQKQKLISLTKNNKMKNNNKSKQPISPNKSLTEINSKKIIKSENQLSFLLNEINNEQSDYFNKQNTFENKVDNEKNIHFHNKSERSKLGKIENPNKDSKRNMANKIVDEFFLKNLYH